ncbi:TonB-dependent receptor [Sphingomonas jatrophae]|uniref:Iron complex outermembrane recepter protein n=1 Tax=Sphingomonas jatrophae TaxID=1166337 RepID=A0A1I6K8Y7_9SPHN|nr:TonB-dependent receptor [Sphingomonas jatrophae]SFR87657.1 iron complex outermembrane recepter protein [Sphingomonas jatrophae]
MAIRGVFTATASLLALMATAAAAQDSAPSDTPSSGAVRPGPSDTGSGDADEIVVTGIRQSLRASIDAKRNSDVVADIISAEDIGKFPDKNVAEALQRIPGVVINRTFGEGERVSLRGTAPNLTKTLVNGHSIATADWFIEDQLAATRSFNYLTLPAEIVGQLDVYKSPQADVEEGGIGGTINVHTRHPLDLAAFSVSASAQAVYSERSDKFDPQASGLVSWKNADETFGVLVGGVYQKRRTRRDGVEILGYTATTVGGQTVQVPSLIGSALFEQKRERIGGNVELQFRPTETLEVIATGLYSRFNADNFNRNFMAWGSNALGGGGTLTGAQVQDGYVTAGTITSTPTGRAVVYDAIYREALAQTWSADLDTTWKPTDADTVHIKIGYTKAKGDTANQPFYEGGAPGSFTFDYTDGRVPEVSFRGIDPDNPSSLIFDFASFHNIGNRDKEKYAYADWQHDLDLGLLSSIKVGAKYTDHDRNTFFLATTYGGFFVPLSTTGCGGRGCTSADFDGGSTPGDFLENIARPGTLTSYWNVDASALASAIAALPASARARIPNPPENFAINEKTYGGYAMAKLGRAGDDFHGNFGVRVIRTEQRSAGNLLGVAPTTPGAVTDNAFGVYLPIEVKRAYTDILPSVNLALNLTPDLVVRFGAGRTVARPDYTDIVPRVSLNPGALAGDGGDPSVQPYRANGADLSIEWYPDRETIFAAALYYKDIKSYIVNRTVQERFPVETSTPNLSRCTPAGTANPNLYNCLFDINRRSNGSGGTNKGIELQASRRIWGPIGAIVNYTYSDASSDSGDPIPGNSKHALNVTGYFENDWLSARLSYNYRSKFFINIDRAAQLNQAATESLDGSINLRLTDNIALTADAVNLTNEKIRQYAGISTAFRARYDNGRIFYAGVRVKY